MRVVSADGSIVFTGDATETEELLAAGQIQPGQVLKVSHHGSNASSSMPFLAAVSPQLAVISVGAANSYGHPGSETLQRLAACGAQVRRTDQDGALKITFDGSQVKCYSYRYQKEFLVAKEYKHGNHGRKNYAAIKCRYTGSWCNRSVRRRRLL
ncbi:MAG: ComEC/Rec2 family competence protein [Phascolarctobacterium faecium]